MIIFFPRVFEILLFDSFVVFLQHPYEDPEGRIDLPVSIKSQVDHWKRPVEFMLEKVEVKVNSTYIHVILLIQLILRQG